MEEEKKDTEPRPTPEKAIEDFMAAWTNKDWGAMAKVCVPAKELVSECERLYSIVKLRRYKIHSLHVTNDIAKALLIFDFCVIEDKHEITKKQRVIKLKHIKKEWKVEHNSLLG